MVKRGREGQPLFPEGRPSHGLPVRGEESKWRSMSSFGGPGSGWGGAPASSQGLRGNASKGQAPRRVHTNAQRAGGHTFHVSDRDRQACP